MISLKDLRNFPSVTRLSPYADQSKSLLNSETETGTHFAMVNHGAAASGTDAKAFVEILN